MSAWGPVFNELWHGRRRDLLAYGSMLTGDLCAAEDLLHEALVATFGGRARFEHVAAAEAYVRRTMASRYIDQFRSLRSRTKAISRLGATEDDQTATPALQAEHATDVGRALSQLTPRQRACVVLRYLNGLSTAETAATLGLAEGTVKRYLSDALRALNDLLGTDEQLSAAPSVPVTKGGKR